MEEPVARSKYVSKPLKLWDPSTETVITAQRIEDYFEHKLDHNEQRILLQDICDTGVLSALNKHWRGATTYFTYIRDFYAELGLIYTTGRRLQ